jgi:predicted MFS family arabinose efflux permease
VAQPELQIETGVSPAEARASTYAWYALGILSLVYMSSNIDRQILAIVIGPIKDEFEVSDTMIGLLAGPAFALFYALFGLPIARWADRGNRRSIIALGLTLWSAMTALSGMAQSFAQLALARIGVAVGEAAGSPPAHSLISDYFPPRSRARALGIYSGGAHLAGPISVIGGAWIAAEYGWRAAFLLFGLPGLLLALLVRTSVREPVRGAMDATPPPPPIDAREAARLLFAKGSYLWMQFGGALHAIVGLGLGTWVYQFMIRVHGLTMQEAGSYVGGLNLLFGLLGVVSGGWLADRASRRDVRWFLWLPALQAAIGAPFAVLFLQLDALGPSLACYAIQWALYTGYNAPIYALMQALAGTRSRALAVATHLFIVNLVGATFGPLLIGFLNDALRASYGDEAIRYSMMVAVLMNAASAVFYLLGARTVRADVETARSQ